MGLLDEGCEIVDAGLSTTPMHYFLVNHLKADGGVMVTASHNPAQYNGFKFSQAGAAPVGAETGLLEIKNIVTRGIFSVPARKGQVREQEVLMEYQKFLLSKISKESLKKLTVVFDTGNGMAGLVLPGILEELPLKSKILFEDIDMAFPNHEDNPLKEETLAALQKAVLKEKADMGVAFDGDGDRVAFVTSKGEVVRGDFILALIASHMLARNPAGKVAYALTCSRRIREVVEEAGGVPVETRVGHSFIKAVMRREKAIVGGEISGHFYYQEFFSNDSALLTFLKVLEIVSTTGKSLSELIAPFKTYAQSGEINLEVDDKDKAIDKIVTHFHDAKSIRYVDGVSIAYDDFWFNIRPSNTEPFLRLNMEAKEKGTLDARLREVVDIVK